MEVITLRDMNGRQADTIAKLQSKIFVLEGKAALRGETERDEAWSKVFSFVYYGSKLETLVLTDNGLVRSCGLNGVLRQIADWKDKAEKYDAMMAAASRLGK